MKPLTKAVVVALAQIVLISSLGAKLLYDRKTCPRAWFKTQRFDPNLPIRGRYLSLRLEVGDSRSQDEVKAKFADEIQREENQRAKYKWIGQIGFGHECGTISVRDGKPVAVFDANSMQWQTCDGMHFSRQLSEGGSTLRLDEPVLFFIPDTAEDPSRVVAGEEVWVLATIPRKGPPRPIALGKKRADEREIHLVKID